MNIIIAMDSFKGSLSSLEAGNITARAAHVVIPDAAIQVFPLADGGEGTLEALTQGLDGEIISLPVTGPLGDRISSRYGLLPRTNTAVLAMADAAGLTLVPQEKRNPLHTTTYGLGELILSAAKRGCRDFIIGLGGSATNDCGLGMLTALGVRFLQADGRPAGIMGQDLATVAQIDDSQLAPIVRQCRFRIACDVTNPLYGPQGCSAVFAPQKGASPAIVRDMDTAIQSFAEKTAQQLGHTGASLPGAGAAGGLGYAFQAFLGASLEPGTPLILDAIGIRTALSTASLVITGEGRMDGQTAMGKAPIGIAALAKALQPAACVIAFCGCALPDADAVNAHGIDAYFPILRQPMDLVAAMEPHTAAETLLRSAPQALRLLRHPLPH